MDLASRGMVVGGLPKRSLSFMGRNREKEREKRSDKERRRRLHTYSEDEIR